MKRIDPATIPDVFRRRGLKPVLETWVGRASGGECCILSALYCDAKGCEEPPVCLAEINEKVSMASEKEFVADLADTLGMGADYANGVWHGWDNGFHVAHLATTTPEQVQGYHDGVEARKACERDGILEVFVDEESEEDFDDDYDYDDDDDFDDDDFDDEEDGE